jgi:hypothetical protein
MDVETKKKSEVKSSSKNAKVEEPEDDDKNGRS